MLIYIAFIMMWDILEKKIRDRVETEIYRVFLMRIFFPGRNHVSETFVDYLTWTSARICVRPWWLCSVRRENPWIPWCLSAFIFSLFDLPANRDKRQRCVKSISAMFFFFWGGDKKTKRTCTTHPCTKWRISAAETSLPLIQGPH